MTKHNIVLPLNGHNTAHKHGHNDHASSPSPTTPDKRIDPPKLHRSMKILCDVMRISEQTRYALRNFDAATLEDFSLMTDGDYSDMIMTQARLGSPIPPLQQRKLRVLLSWAQSLPNVDQSTVKKTPKSEGYELKQSTALKGSEAEAGAGGGAVVATGYKISQRKENGPEIPADWESRFYDDLPLMRKELRRMGGNDTSTWMTNFLSWKWMFCEW
ncbi:hypothetical protein ACHAXS_009138 [Conticribra weissflogii]